MKKSKLPLIVKGKTPRGWHVHTKEEMRKWDFPYPAEKDLDLEIKVTRIGNRYHARLISGETKVILDEMACTSRIDIGWICREMLRWFDKLGGVSKFAASARKRQTGNPVGKVWYKNQLEKNDGRPN